MVVRYRAAPGTLLAMKRRGGERGRAQAFKRKRSGGRRGGGVLATTGEQLVPANPTVLGREFFGGRIPQSENYRQYYGKYLDMVRIDHAIRAAAQGWMRPLTDVGRETVSFDGHLASLLQKRLNRLAALDHDIVPAAGDGINADRAEEYASFVRAQIEGLPRFRDRLVDLAWGAWDARAASEIEWRYRTSRIWQVMDLHWIHPRRISYGRFRDLRVVDAQADSGDFLDRGFPLEQVPYKFVTYRPRLFNDYPEREGLAIRALYWSFFARFGTRERLTLMELFSAPWRVLRPDPTQGSGLVNDDGAVNAFEEVKRLGQRGAIRLPQGWLLDVIQPTPSTTHADAIDHATKVLSKLILGNTGTTDAVSTGLGSSIGDAHLSEEDLIIWSDARRLAEVIEDQLTDAIIAVNFGPDAVDHAPRFVFRTEPPTTREQEAARIKSALEIGLRVSVEEAHEKLGIQEVREGEPFLQRVQRPAELNQAPPPPAPEIVYPAGKAPTPGEVVEQPAVAINLPAGGGAAVPPVTPPAGALPPGSPPPPALPPGAPPGSDPAAQMSDAEVDPAATLAAKMTELALERCSHGRTNRCPLCGIERVYDVELVDGAPQWQIAWRPIPSGQTFLPTLSAQEIETLARESEPDPEWDPRTLTNMAGRHICLARQPETVFGSPETCVDRGVDETSTQTGKFADSIVAAVRGLSSARQIRDAIDRAAEQFDNGRIAAPIERELLQGGMLGALDSWFEMEEGVTIEVESFGALHEQLMKLDARRVLAESDRRFAGKPINEAIKSFLERKAVTRDEFDSMEAAAQRKAFTVANAANREMVRTVKRELIRQVAVGADLSDFGKHAAERFEQAGWTPVNSSHVETVFRTNVINAYSGGRVRQMSQPDVLEARPFWQIMGVRDARQRDSHGAVHGAVLRANDPFWKTAAPPFGFNCRCRIRSLSLLKGAGKVEEGNSAKFRALPDAGFTSGINRLL